MTRLAWMRQPAVNESALVNFGRRFGNVDVERFGWAAEEELEGAPVMIWDELRLWGLRVLLLFSNLYNCFRDIAETTYDGIHFTTNTLDWVNQVKPTDTKKMINIFVTKYYRLCLLPFAGTGVQITSGRHFHLCNLLPLCHYHNFF